MLPIHADFLGLVVSRMWTKPWKYKVGTIAWDRPHVEKVLATNLTREGVMGVIKLLKEK